MKEQAYSIKLETRSTDKFLQAEKLVKQIAKSQGAGETSNLDLCYFLNDEGRARVKFDRPYVPMSKRTIEMTDSVNPGIMSSIIKILYS